MKAQTPAQTDHLVTLEEAIQDYLLVLRVSKSPKSTERAQWSLRKLQTWCHAHHIGNLQDLTRRDLLTWCLALQQECRSKQTLWTVTSTVKAFLTWCEQEGLLPHAILKRGDFPSKPKPAPQPLTVEELQAVLATATGKDWISKRDVALLTVLLHSGCRRGELVQMKAGDVVRGFSLVTQKGGRQHVIHLHAECVKAIQSYQHALLVQKGIRLKPEDALWIGQRGEPLTGNAVRLIFRRLSQQTGMRLTAHRMRHTSATWRLASGASTELVRLALGHADTRSIQSYIQLAQADASRLLAETSPLQLLKHQSKHA